MELDSLSSLEKREILFTDIKNAIEVQWINMSKLPNDDAIIRSSLTMSDIDSAEARLRRFSPFIKMVFPETVETNGIIESPLVEAPGLRAALNGVKIDAGIAGKLYLKLDSELPIAGSVKARGGIYEVLKHTEELAVKSGVLDSYEDDYCKIASPAGKAFFATKKIQTGSTGNLGLSIGIAGAAIGYETIVHMSSDAAQWKKDLLRSKGVRVVEYDGDYTQAVAKGRAESDADPDSYFVDDENSADLFLGYAVAAKRLKKQLRQQKIQVDEKHPLFVYIPCGVGGAPGGITFGLRQFLGNDVHCFFVEPTQAPCTLLGMVTGLYNNISVQDIGLSGKTYADGLAVGRPSAFIGDFIKPFFDGIVTVKDKRLFEYMRYLWNSEKIFIEPSSCAAIHGPVIMNHSSEMSDYLFDNNLTRYMENAVHIIWATGGSLVPDEIRKEMLEKRV
ncbi:MAG: D-serine ammonia-lyase [Anaerovibrio sp.]|uniref:D-serine ammonia-lyase n=1 Tax=Anaerovibrio sp. TaxID=1872532 RepID=UPI0025D1919D|nr:D-serine ammonia-lyase [Anaerovibrio sp.]MCR5175499.1 D-serine ammonia-lyase [Anaerovibrio sp.]